MRTIEVIERELKAATEEENAQYCAFSRRAKAPPVSCDLCRRISELKTELSNRKWERELGL